MVFGGFPPSFGMLRDPAHAEPLELWLCWSKYGSRSVTTSFPRAGPGLPRVAVGTSARKAGLASPNGDYGHDNNAFDVVLARAPLVVRQRKKCKEGSPKLYVFSTAVVSKSSKTHTFCLILTGSELSCKIENVGCVACLATIKNRVSQVLAEDEDLRLEGDIELLSDLDSRDEEGRPTKISRARIRIFAADDGISTDIRSKVEGRLCSALDEIGFPTKFDS